VSVPPAALSVYGSLSVPIAVHCGAPPLEEVIIAFAVVDSAPQALELEPYIIAFDVAVEGYVAVVLPQFVPFDCISVFAVPAVAG
jgi:hypothetical protein